MELWKPIELFEEYSVSSHGRIRSDKSGRILATNETQWGLVQVGLMRNGIQYHRSVPLLVAKAYIPIKPEAFDTPINLDGDRHNNHVDNLMWRPRWFAIKYNKQFRYWAEGHISSRIQDTKNDAISENSLECAKQYGLLEEDIIMSINMRTYVWPTYQTFRVLPN